MTNFSEQFSSQLPALEQAFAAMPGEPSTVPGLTKDHLLAFLKSFEGLLAKVDNGSGVDFPSLAYSNTNAPQHFISLLPTILSQTGNGADHFVQSYLPTLFDLRSRLEAATGSSSLPDQSPPAMRRRLTTLERLLESSRKAAEDATTQSAETEEVLGKVQAVATDAEAQRERLSAIMAEVEKLRDRALFVVNDESDAETPSVETIYGQLNEKRSEADGILKKIDEASKRANKTAASIEQLKGNAESLRKDAQGVLDQAKSAMRGATQAGLAESFISERDSKMTGLAIYGGALVVAVVGAIIFAVKEVLPAIDLLTKAVATRSNDIGALSTGLLIRSVLLAPFVFLGWFAAVQYRRIDLLRIDYAAKAAAAKAYVGYKDEMKDDPKLVAALKAHLIQRFGEHPVRLVTKEHDENVPIDLFGLGPSGHEKPSN